MSLYRLLVRLLALVTAVFFRTREVAGRERVPRAGPVIFAGNHPNSLLDPVLILTTCGRPVRFAAKDVLFQSPFLRPLLRVLGAIPVRRRKDHPGAAAGGTIDNQAAFEAMFEALAAGDACGIFPEGISHDGSELAPLRTGLARIALGAAARRPIGAAPVRIVPCGLSYFSPTRMRSRVLIEYGPPLEIDAAWLEAHTRDERATVQALTEAVEAGLRALTVNAPDYETLRVLTGVRQLYVPSDLELPLAAQAELSRRFLDRYQDLKADPQVVALYRDVGAYLTQVDSLGFTDPLLRAPLTLGGWARLLGSHLLLIFVLLPLAIPGLVLHAPLLAAAVVFGDGLTRKRNVRATTKLVTLAVGVILIHGLLLGGVAWLSPRPDRLVLTLCAAAFLPVCGWATIRVLERQSALRHAFVTLSLLVLLRREVGRLREVREALRARIREAVERHAGDIQRIVTPPG